MKTNGILKRVMLSLILITIGVTMNAQQKKYMDDILKPFPAAMDSLVRYVIELDEKADEYSYKVELIPGKVMLVDCNRHRLAGKLQEKTLEGWGYNYYEFYTNGQVASTMMLCHDPKEEKYVSGESIIVRYNSKLPIVVYAPKGYEIRYRIWQAGEEQSTLEK